MFGSHLTKLQANIEFRVPKWKYCNHKKAEKGHRRFCVKSPRNGVYVCVLHNVPLDTGGKYVYKALECEDACAESRCAMTIEDMVEEAKLDVSDIIKSTIRDYNKIYKGLRAQGYTEALADKAATDYLINNSKED
jgi:hypothetical protein